MTTLRHLREPSWRTFLPVLFLLAFALRWATFGDPALHTDEEFYFLVGQKMLDGALPYVDIWDRKPLGLFAIYAGIAAVSRSVVAYQVAATISAASTAFILTRITPGKWQGKAVCGAGYLILLLGCGGHGGQAPVFYNLPMATAALLIVRSIPELETGHIPRRVTLAMLLCGLSLTIKPTTVVEGIAFGSFALALASTNGGKAPRLLGHLVAFALAGSLPTAFIGLFYWAAGHGAEWWQAMVSSNFAKGGYESDILQIYVFKFVAPIYIPFLLAAAGLIALPSSSLRLFLGLWLVAAITAVFLVPNFYRHYTLPLLLPLCCLGGYFCGRFPRILPLVGVLAMFALWKWDAFDRAWHVKSRVQSERVAQAIVANRTRKSLLIYDGNVYLYALSGGEPLSRLVLPWHFREQIEANATGKPANVELAALLAKQPGAVTLADWAYMSDRENKVGHAMVKAWVQRHCRNAGTFPMNEDRFDFPVTVYAPCD